MKLYVGNIPVTATEQDIKGHFARFGPGNVKIIKDHATGRSRGFCFIDMPEENGQKAIDEMNKTEFMGVIIVVNRHVKNKMPVQKDAWKYKYVKRQL